MKGIVIQRSSVCRTFIIAVIIIAAVLSGCSKKEASPGYTIEPSATPSVPAAETPEPVLTQSPEPALTPSPTATPESPVTILDAAIAQAPILDNGTTIEDIALFLNQSEDELLEQYKKHIKYTREDDPYNEYYFSSLGINLVCYSKDNNTEGIVKYVELDNNKIAWSGIDTSMNFKQVTDILGEAKIHVLADGLPESTTYELRYQYENIKLRIYSWDADGNGGIYISVVDDFIPEYRPIRITPEQIDHYFDLSFEELRQEIGGVDKVNPVFKEYSRYGVKFRYDEQQQRLMTMVFNARYQINGLKNGISLKDAMKVMGKTEIKTYLSEEEGPAHFIQYKFRNFTLQVWSYDDYGWQAKWGILRNEYVEEF